MSGGGGSQTTKQEIPKELKPLATEYVNRAQQVANTPYQAYGGQRYSGLNGTQNAGIDMITQRAQQGSQVANAADQQTLGTLGGSYLGSTPTQNTAAGATNPYGGSNPYLQQQIDAAQQDVVRNYSLTSKPQMEAAMVNSGSFGNSGLQQMQQESQRGLADQLGQISSGMRMQDYTAQQGLAENSLNRQFQAGQSYADASNNAFQNERSRQMQAAGLAPTLANSQYQDAAQMLSAGQLQQDNSQNSLDFAYQQFQDQQNNPYKQLTALGAPLGVNMGGTTVTTGGGK